MGGSGCPTSPAFGEVEYAAGVSGSPGPEAAVCFASHCFCFSRNSRIRVASLQALITAFPLAGGMPPVARACAVCERTYRIDASSSRSGTSTRRPAHPSAYFRCAWHNSSPREAQRPQCRPLGPMCSQRCCSCASLCCVSSIVTCSFMLSPDPCRRSSGKKKGWLYASPPKETRTGQPSTNRRSRHVRPARTRSSPDTRRQKEKALPPQQSLLDFHLISSEYQVHKTRVSTFFGRSASLRVSEPA